MGLFVARVCNNISDLLFFTLAPSYRLQDEQVGHFQAPPGGLRVPNSDRWEYRMRLAHTSLSFALCNPPGAVLVTVPW